MIFEKAIKEVKGCGKILDADEMGVIYCGTNEGVFLCPTCQKEKETLQELRLKLEHLEDNHAEYTFLGRLEIYETKEKINKFLKKLEGGK